MKIKSSFGQLIKGKNKKNIVGQRLKICKENLNKNENLDRILQNSVFIYLIFSLIFIFSFFLKREKENMKKHFFKEIRAFSLFFFLF